MYLNHEPHSAEYLVYVLLKGSRGLSRLFELYEEEVAPFPYDYAVGPPTASLEVELYSLNLNVVTP